MPLVEIQLHFEADTRPKTCSIRVKTGLSCHTRHIVQVHVRITCLQTWPTGKHMVVIFVMCNRGIEESKYNHSTHPYHSRESINRNYRPHTHLTLCTGTKENTRRQKRTHTPTNKYQQQYECPSPTNTHICFDLE